MEIVEYKGYEVHMDFIRLKYGMARWDYTIYKDREEISSGGNVNTMSHDVNEAVEEIFQFNAEMRIGSLCEEVLNVFDMGYCDQEMVDFITADEDLDGITILEWTKTIVKLDVDGYAVEMEYVVSQQYEREWQVNQKGWDRVDNIRMLKIEPKKKKGDGL